ncbi:MAG: alpha/beta hydrolase [Elusimicrobia bacterium]|nr:alpha/beta hydrolase [Elusimicrobiota bacterium]
MTWVIVSFIVVAVVLWGWFSSNLILMQERCPIQALPGAFGLPFETVSFHAEDGVRLSGWFVPAARPTEITLILCHGWGANRSDILFGTVFLQKRGGYNLFYFDFRNHGDSGGTRSSLIGYERLDLEAAIRCVKEQWPDRSRRVALFGLSMGGANALSVAAKHPEIEAVVAESPFSSFNGVVIRFARLFHHVPRFPLVDITLLFTKIRLGMNPEVHSPIHHIDKISPRPIFLIQGDRDARMPPSEGERLFAKAKEPKTLWTIPGADHGEPGQVAGKEYEDRILEFYKNVFEK